MTHIEMTHGLDKGVARVGYQGWSNCSGNCFADLSPSYP